MTTREVRDEILKALSNNFESTDLLIIDKAIEEVINNLNISPQETNLCMIDNCMPEVLQYLVRKRRKDYQKEH